MGKIRSRIEKIGQSYKIEISPQLVEYIGLKEGDEIEFEPKKVFELTKEVLDTRKEVKIKLIATCFRYGVSTISTKDRALFPPDRHPFILEINGRDYVKHVASHKIAMKDFFDRNSELEGKEHITIEIIEPFEKYKLVY